MTSPGVHQREVTDDDRDAAAEPEARPWHRAVYYGEEPGRLVMLSWC
jgi:diamine N-acetyltransferase